MLLDLTASGTTTINADSSKIWNVLTNPEIIKEYLFGTETITDWKPGNEIVFQGEYQGKKYKDKGIVRENINNKFISYSYWSAFSGVEDKPENYSLVTYTINSKSKDQSDFTWSQKGFAKEESYEHCKQGMQGLLDQIKKLAEK